jgi:hypothetical protein
MSDNATTATTAADTVAATLANHPDGITVRDLATEAGVGTSTAAKTLAAMETAGTATRTPGPTNGNRKGADIWHPVTGDAATPDEAPVADDATATPDEAPVADDATATDDEAPVPAAPRQPDLKVLIMAGVLGDHPDGVEATVAIAESGLAPATGDTILAAMEVAGAARRLPVTEDGAELWVRGDGDLSTVDPANAPTHTTCPTCGHTRRIRRPSATGRRNGTGTGRATGEINSDGSVKLGKNGLRNLVEAFTRDLGPGHEVSPGTVGRELGGRSSGACLNAMNTLTGLGVLVMTNPAPVRFAMADNPPPPSPEVAALMTRRAVAADDAPADEAPANEAPADEAPADEAPADEAPADEARAA